MVSLVRLLLLVCQVGDKGLAGVDRLDEPGGKFDVSIAESSEISFKASKIFSPSDSVVKAWVLPLKANFKANGNPHQYLMSFWDKISNKGFSDLRLCMVAAEMSAEI